MSPPFELLVAVLRFSHLNGFGHSGTARRPECTDSIRFFAAGFSPWPRRAGRKSKSKMRTACPVADFGTLAAPLETEVWRRLDEIAPVPCTGIAQPCHRAAPATRRSESTHRSGFVGPRCLHPIGAGSASGVFYVSRPPVGSLALRPGDSLTIPKMAFSVGFRSFGFPPACDSGYRAPDSCPGGIGSRWMRQPKAKRTQFSLIVQSESDPSLCDPIFFRGFERRRECTEGGSSRA